MAARRWDEKGFGMFKIAQASDLGSIPIARSINLVDSVALALLRVDGRLTLIGKVPVPTVSGHAIRHVSKHLF